MKHFVNRHVFFRIVWELKRLNFKFSSGSDMFTMPPPTKRQNKTAALNPGDALSSISVHLRSSHQGEMLVTGVDYCRAAFRLFEWGKKWFAGQQLLKKQRHHQPVWYQPLLLCAAMHITGGHALRNAPAHQQLGPLGEAQYFASHLSVAIPVSSPTSPVLHWVVDQKGFVHPFKTVLSWGSFLKKRGGGITAW